MSERGDKQQYLMGAAAGYTCLALSLLIYLAEGTLVKADWIPERTPNAFVGIGMAILFLFPASLAHGRMLARRSGADTGQPPELLNVRWLVCKTVLLTLALGLLVEAFAVGFGAMGHFPGP